MSRNSFMDKGKKLAYRRSPIQEKELAKKGNGRLIPGSGCFHVKGDVAKYNGIYRIEAKTTTKKSFSITRDMVEKIENAALVSNELPAIIVEFINPDSGDPEMEVAVIPRYVLDNYYE